MEITIERNEPAQRRPSPHRCSNVLVYADSATLPRYAGAMKSQKNRHILNCALLITSVAAVFLIPFEAFARHSAATPA
jgi:hypothetical protein